MIELYCYWNTWRTKVIVDEAMDTQDAFYLGSRLNSFSFNFYVHFYPFHWWFWYWSLKPVHYQTSFAQIWDLKFRLPSCEFEFSFSRYYRRKYENRYEPR